MPDTVITPMSYQVPPLSAQPMPTNISQKKGPNTDAEKFRRILPSTLLLHGPTGVSSQMTSIEQQKRRAIGRSSWKLEQLHARERQSATPSVLRLMDMESLVKMSRRTYKSSFSQADNCAEKRLCIAPQLVLA
jgi:hypothetical protein